MVPNGNGSAENRQKLQKVVRVSSFQIQIADFDILTAGDHPDVTPHDRAALQYLLRGRDTWTVG